MPFGEWLGGWRRPNRCEFDSRQLGRLGLLAGSGFVAAERRFGVKLQPILRPKMGAPKSARRTTKDFDFTFEHDTGTGPYGIYKSKIRSFMTIFNNCKQLDTDDHRCLSYYS